MPTTTSDGLLNGGGAGRGGPDLINAYVSPPFLILIFFIELLGMLSVKMMRTTAFVRDKSRLVSTRGGG